MNFRVRRVAADNLAGLAEKWIQEDPNDAARQDMYGSIYNNLKTAEIQVEDLEADAALQKAGKALMDLGLLTQDEFDELTEK